MMNVNATINATDHFQQNNDESTLGIAIFEAEDESTARNIMENDPAVKGGVMTAELYPYQIALMRK